MKKLLLTSALLLTAACLSAEDGTWIDQVAAWYEAHTNYASITALMAIESSFIPFPSEIIIPPAAYVASEGTADISIIGVVLSGTLGALIGAFVNYFLALWLGRPIVYKFADSKLGHLLLLNGEKVGKAEDYFNKHGKISTLIGRLIPAVRQLISIPAGLARMNIGAFALFTALGAGVWNTVLALLGYAAHGQKDLINQYSRELSQVLLGLLALLILYFTARYVWNKKKTTAD